MLSDKAYFWLSERAYWVDSKKGALSQQMKVDQTYFYDPNELEGEAFRVLKLLDDQQTGMQALAIAPIDEQNQVDYSRVVISYAGTNMSDDLDKKADVMEVVLGIKGEQTESAEKFYHSVKEMYPQATIGTTGHSLGGFLAQYVAMENQLESTVYNAPDPYRILSESAKTYIAENKAYHINYRHSRDVIGNFGPDTTDTHVYVHGSVLLRNQQDDFWTKLFMGTHLLATWKSYFNAAGDLVSATGRLGKQRKSRANVEQDGRSIPKHIAGAFHASVSIRVSPDLLRQISKELKRLSSESQRVLGKIDKVVYRINDTQYGESVRAYAQMYRQFKTHLLKMTETIDILASDTLKVAEEFSKTDKSASVGWSQ